MLCWVCVYFWGFNDLVKCCHVIKVHPVLGLYEACVERVVKILFKVIFGK